MALSSYRELRVYDKAMDACMQTFEWSKGFPTEERYSLTDQIRRSSRSVCANLAEAWRCRRYQAAFISKLTDSSREASETQVWIEIGRRCGYLTAEQAAHLDSAYDHISAQLVKMIQSPQKWIIRGVSVPVEPNAAIEVAQRAPTRPFERPATRSSR